MWCCLHLPSHPLSSTCSQGIHHLKWMSALQTDFSPEHLSHLRSILLIPSFSTGSLNILNYCPRWASKPCTHLQQGRPHLWSQPCSWGHHYEHSVHQPHKAHSMLRKTAFSVSPSFQSVTFFFPTSTYQCTQDSNKELFCFNNYQKEFSIFRSTYESSKRI